MKCTECGHDIKIDYRIMLFSNVTVEDILEGKVVINGMKLPKTADMDDVYVDAHCRCTEKGYKDGPSISREDWDKIKNSILGENYLWQNGYEMEDKT